MARQSMVDRNAPIGAGICQEKTANVFPTIPKYIQRYVMTPLNTDVKMNGKKKIDSALVVFRKLAAQKFRIWKVRSRLSRRCLVVWTWIASLKGKCENGTRTTDDNEICPEWCRENIRQILTSHFSAALIERFPSRIGPRIPASAASWTPKNQNK